MNKIETENYHKLLKMPKKRQWIKFLPDCKE